MIGLKKILCGFIAALMLPFNSLAMGACSKVEEVMYYYPGEESLHSATWLTWPHEFTYGKSYKKEVEPIWIEMTKQLISSETVNIIAYNEKEKASIIRTLTLNGVALDNIGIFIAASNDVWVRDTGPIFVKDGDGKLFIADFAFDGWGEKCDFDLDDKIPQAISGATAIPRLDISDFVLEGGSVELDGNGTCMATLSSVVSKNRNPDLSVKDAEYYISKYLGATNFIWLDGVTDEDITDAHIDGMARFYDSNTILTVSENDFLELYESIKPSDYHKLSSAKNADGQKYELVNLPLTAKNVKGLDYKGSYLNFYIANNIIIMPTYGDANDVSAQNILAELYPSKTIIPINVTALYKYGGMIHCITQQQPK